MKVTYQSVRYHPDAVDARYVRYDPDGTFHFAEVQETTVGGKPWRLDVRQGTVEDAELPRDVRNAAVRATGIFPSYVPWPF